MVCSLGIYFATDGEKFETAYPGSDMKFRIKFRNGAKYCNNKNPCLVRQGFCINQSF